MTDLEKELVEKLAKALDFMYRYFVMPGHPERAKDCPNKDCPFCKADEALAAYRERMGNYILNFLKDVEN